MHMYYFHEILSNFKNCGFSEDSKSILPGCVTRNTKEFHTSE